VPTSTRFFTIGEIARRSGVATSALRFYEDDGLIQSERTVLGTAATTPTCCDASASSARRNSSA
jgi:hypothetical protein